MPFMRTRVQKKKTHSEVFSKCDAIDIRKLHLSPKSAKFFQVPKPNNVSRRSYQVLGKYCVPNRAAGRKERTASPP